MSSGVYYNELDPHLCWWIRNLIDAQELPAGRVDNRSIAAVDPDELSGYHRVHFFAGIGLWELAARYAEWPDSAPLWTGSCPCQPFSRVGKRKGTQDDRHLWPEMLRLIAAGRPPVVVGEQVAGKLGRQWFAGVQADLEAQDYDSIAVGLNACSVGAPHIRSRIYWVGHSKRAGLEGLLWPSQPCNQSRRHDAQSSGSAPPPAFRQVFKGDTRQYDRINWNTSTTSCWQARHEPGVSPVADGDSPYLEPARTRRAQIKAYGNAIVPQLAAHFLIELKKGPLP